MKKLALLFTFVLFVSVLSASAQEICNNGIDDDNNGFIDCFDRACAGISAFCEDFYLGDNPTCSIPPKANPDFNMTLDFATPDETTNHLGRIVVGDIDRDGIPEIVTVNRFTRTIFVLNGRTGQIIRSRTTTFAPGYEDIAIANLKNDNCAEIFIVDTGGRLYSFDCNLNQIWGPVSLPGSDPGMFGLADFNGDGLVELYAKDVILNAETGAILVASTAPNWGELNAGPVAVDITDHPTDASKNEDLELVIGCKIYSVNLAGGTLTLVKELPQYFVRNIWNATSVADFNLDGHLDVIATGSTGGHNQNTTIFFWDVQNNTHTTYAATLPAGDPLNNGGKYTNGWGQGTGRINIADLDGDGNLNLSFVTGKFLYALDHNMNKLWSKVINEETSGYTGCTLFDFNGDGKSEIVYRDERFLYILDGTTGNILTQQTCVSRTNREYPVVADVDADGQTELCVTCRTVDFYPGTDANGNSLNEIDFNTLDRSRYSQVRVFKTAADPWVPARRVWNQHGYFNVNVNDDLTIPRKQQKHHRVFSNTKCRDSEAQPRERRPLNSFLNQSPFLNIDGCAVAKAPDLVPVNNSIQVNTPTCPERNFTISFSFQNIGEADAKGNMPVTFYNGDPGSGGVKLNTINVPITKLAKDETQQVNNVMVNGPGGTFILFISLNDNGQGYPPDYSASEILECDPGGLFSVNVGFRPVPTVTGGRDSEKCDPLGVDNGMVKAYALVNGVRDSTNFNFYWSIGSTPKPVGSQDHIGFIYPQRGQDTYTVFGVHKTANCTTDTTSISIGQQSLPIALKILILSQDLSCQTPTGSMKVIINDRNNDDISDDNPADYEIRWFEGANVVTGIPLGNAEIISNLQGAPAGKAYTVQVTHKGLRCDQFTSASITSPASPIVTTTSKDEHCTNDLGYVEAAVTGGPVQNYNYYWYRGQSIKPTPDNADITNPRFSGLNSGDYVVVAEDKQTKCKSLPDTIAVVQTPGFVVTAQALQGQSSCDVTAPNGQASASVNGTTAGYNFEWYRGLDTSIIANRVSTNAITDANLATGIYTVVASQTGGCTNTTTVNITNDVQPMAITAIQPRDASSCSPNDGEIVVTTLNGDIPANFDFFWYNGNSVKPVSDYPGNNTNILSGLAPGTYTVRAVHRTKKCSTPSATRTIGTSVPSLNFTAIPNHATDCTNGLGSIDVAVNSVNQNGYTFTWYKGSVANAANEVPSSSNDIITTNSYSNLDLIPGIYTIVIEDNDNGCRTTQQVTLNYADHAITATAPSMIHCTEQPGTFQVTFTNMLPDANYDVYMYESETMPPIPDPASGFLMTQVGSQTYEITRDVKEITYSFVAIVVSSINPNALNCRTFATASVQKNVADPNFDETTTAITQNSRCNVNTGVTGDGSIQLTLQPPSNNPGLAYNPAHYIFTWMDVNGIELVDGSNNPLSATDNIAGLSPGQYLVNVTFSGSSPMNRGCEKQLLVQILDDAKPIWIDMDSQFFIQAVSNCNPADGVTPMAIGSAAFQGILEDGVADPSFSTGAYQYDWRIASSNAVVADNDAQAWDRMGMLAAGDYYVTATKNNTACDIRVPFTVPSTVLPKPPVSLQNFVVPQECLFHELTTAHFNTNDPILGILEVRPQANLNYIWYAGSEQPVGSEGPHIATTNALYNLTPGVYTVRVTDPNTNCINQESYTLVPNPNPVSITTSSIDEITCTGSNIQLAEARVGVLNTGSSKEINSTLSVFGIAGTFNYTWRDGNNNVVSTQNVLTGVSAGTYNVRVENTVNNQCFATGTVTINTSHRDYTLMTRSSNQTSCEIFMNGQLIANGLVMAFVEDGRYPDGNIYDYNFQWQNIPAENPNTTNNYIITSLPAGTYTVSSTNIFNNCTATATAVVGVPAQFDVPLPIIEILAHDNHCSEDNGKLSATVDGNVTDYTFRWTGGTLTTPVEFYELFNVGEGEYRVQVVHKSTGCRGEATERILFTPQYPEFHYDIKNASCEKENGLVSLYIVNDVGLSTIEWFDADNNFITYGPFLSNAKAGRYQIKVTSDFSCPTDKTVDILADIHPYNGISRNGDGNNEIFYINCIDNYPNNIVKIYNRVGTLVYEAVGYDNSSTFFDGKSNKGLSVMGNNVPDGTYFYIIDKRDGTKPLAGYLEIVN